MLSKIIRVAKLPNLTSSGNFTRRSKAIRWFTTESQPPKPAEPIAKPAEPAAKPPPAQPKASTAQQSTKAADPSKGKIYSTSSWKFLIKFLCLLKVKDR